MNQMVLYAAFMLVAGIGIPVMAALNSRLGSELGNPALATTILFVVGFIVSAAYMLKVQGAPDVDALSGVPWYLYLGGTLVVFYVFSITWVSPRFGIGNAVSFVLLGQLIAISVIDQFGLFGALKASIDLKRALGLMLMAAGIFLVVKRG